MPMDRSLYHHNWDEIATQIKDEASWCCVECGRPCRKPGESIGEHYIRLKDSGNVSWLNDYWANWVQGNDYNGHGDGGIPPNKAGRFILPVAHLDHRPENCDRVNLKALCAPCHCRYDNTPESRAIKKKLKLERSGQLTLEVL